MAVKSLEEILASVHTIIGDNTSDEALTLMDDISDTFKNKDETDWKQKFEENDAAWRQRYKDRFLSGDTDLDKDLDDDEPEEEIKTYKFEDLFKEG